MKNSSKNQKVHQSGSVATENSKISQSGEPKYREGTLTYNLAFLIKKAVEVTHSDIQISLEEIDLDHPTLEEHGDYATNIALRLSKRIGTSPREIAKKLMNKINEINKISDKNKENILGKVEIAGPGFINFFLSKDILIRGIGEIRNGGELYGSSEIGKGKTVIIDYSAPNIAKPFGIGHLRSTIIGQAIYNLYKFSGYKTIGDNHLGDWGTQFGKLLYMIDAEKPEKLSIEKLEELYVKFHRLVEQDKALEDKGRAWFKKLEDGDSVARELWQKCVDISLEEFDRIYELLGVKIDYAYGEAFYEKMMPEVISEAKDKKIAHLSDGALVIDVPNQKAPLMLLKSDGGTTYATRDLATLKFRKKEWNPDVIIYEVGGEQALHFVQVFEAAKILGYVKDTTLLIHTRHGLYLGPDGKKFSTRKGKTVKLEDVLAEAIKRAGELGDKESAEDVGIGAIKYFDLKHVVQGDIIFDWEKMFELQGDSGPYLQYTYARARSILRKSQIINTKVQKEPAKLESEELSLVRYLYRFPEVVESATRNYSPNLVCTYLYELAKRFNNFYNNVQILGASSQQLAASRIQLTEATSIVLKNGLNLLGIKALEKM